jgi:putative nucleotidyltransferase with HDIG domain
LPPFRSLSWSARAYLVGVIAAGVVLLALGWLIHPIPFDSHHIPTLLYLAVGTQIAALRPIPWKSGHQSVVDPLLTATGLIFPGGGVGLVAWLALWDGRVPGRSMTWWAFFFNRAMTATVHIIPSLAVASIDESTWWGIPLKAASYVIGLVILNYVLTALLFSYVRHISFLTTISQNVGATTMLATLALSFAGGILYLLLTYAPGPVGYIMAPGLFGFVLAVRGNVADAQRQGELKDQTLDLAAQALDARDRYTESHSIRVSELAGRLGEQLELGDRECELIRTAGSLHDLGKIGVRDDILNKPGPLTEDEWEIMRRHSDIGADMIAQHSALTQVAPLVRHHHERWDGTGYPAGLQGDVIPFGARILAVADSFDTITGPRLYRQSLMTPIEGVEDISRRANYWYDPNVVDALRELHGLKPLEVLDRPEVPRRITTIRVLTSNPAFTSLVAAIGISSIGDPMTLVATLISIYAYTHAPLAVALAFIAQALGTVLMSSVLGGVADRFARKQLIVALELLRASVLVATPFLMGYWLWWIIPILFVLASINAIVQPARQAAIPLLVPAGQVGKANAIVAATTMLAGALGYGLTGGILSLVAVFRQPIQVLFYVDAATFVLAATILLSVPSLGGGAPAAAMVGGMRRAWSIAAARPHFVVGALAAFFLAMSFPSLVAMADQLSHDNGQTYAMFEVVLSLGIFAGSIAVGRVSSIGSLRTLGAGLLLTGVFSLVIGLSSSVAMVAAGLLIASIGNPIYAVANQTALMEAADASNRGSVMATRFGFVQTASILGAGTGGLIASQFQPNGPFVAYGVLGVGLILLAMYALAAGRSIVNPILGSPYEEAQRKAAPAQQPSQLT